MPLTSMNTGIKSKIKEKKQECSRLFAMFLFFTFVTNYPSVINFALAKTCKSIEYSIVIVRNMVLIDT